jgi:hypothetical protein
MSLDTAEEFMESKPYGIDVSILTFGAMVVSTCHFPAPKVSLRHVHLTQPTILVIILDPCG